MASYVRLGSARQSDETMNDDNDDKDDTKRKSRNLSEKKRRDQFNMLVNELGSMVSTNTRKMDKSTVLKSTILFLKNHNEIAVRSRAHEIQEDWKPSFLSNEEFTHLILEALDGFIMVFSSNGRIYYASESVTSLLGYLPSELSNSTIYEITYEEDQSLLYNILLNPTTTREQGIKEENQVSFTCHIKRGSLDFQEEPTYERVRFVGYFRSDIDIESLIPSSRYGNNITNDPKIVFVGTGRLLTPHLIQDMSLVDGSKSEFTSRHSLEWKFLFLDHRAPPIIGYLPFEVLGTSGYDYYHVDDLDKVVTCHESLMQKGEGTSCHYRFLTKGQQWIWLQTRFYIDYNQWNSKPEFIVCTHNVVSYTEVIKQIKNIKDDAMINQTTTSSSGIQQGSTPQQTPTNTWSPKSWKASRSGMTPSRNTYHGGGSDTTSISHRSHSSRQSTSLTTHSNKQKVTPGNNSTPLPQPETSPQQHSQPKVDLTCSGYTEPTSFPNNPILSNIPTTSFLVPAVPTVPITLPSNITLGNQQNIVLTRTQNQIQDELQRKHEELQQLIVHQQEELRRVSEQLLIARYGTLPPLINVNLPYNVNPCQQPTTCDDPSSGNASQEAETVTGMNILPVPVTLPLPIVPMETFPHSTTVIPVAAPIVITSRVTDTLQVNPGVSYITQQRLSQDATQQLPRHESQQIQHIQQAQAIHQDNHGSHIIPFQLCQQSEMIYSNVEPSVTRQNRSSINQ
ncbi:circadian locomoter output cycles protein kaput [Chelonus insularis]|uniref:circadian locomoter output cycles protein kaput n=1 Tax=Chelonus insularis TaxID=460826 RepID=UPI00158C4A66|nr:circadian locomoter output cycles protein kaput [Chelonus insularis]